MQMQEDQLHVPLVSTSQLFWDVHVWSDEEVCSNISQEHSQIDDYNVHNDPNI